MDNCEINVEKTFQAGEDIIKIVKDCEQQLEDLKKRISNMPKQTQEWQGSSADKFVLYFNEDIAKYQKALATVEAFANQLKSDANEYNNITKRVKI